MNNVNAGKYERYIDFQPFYIHYTQAVLLRACIRLISWVWPNQSISLHIYCRCRIIEWKNHDKNQGRSIECYICCRFLFTLLLIYFYHFILTNWTNPCGSKSVFLVNYLLSQNEMDSVHVFSISIEKWKIQVYSRYSKWRIHRIRQVSNSRQNGQKCLCCHSIINFEKKSKNNNVVYLVYFPIFFISCQLRAEDEKCYCLNKKVNQIFYFYWCSKTNYKSVCFRSLVQSDKDVSIWVTRMVPRVIHAVQIFLFCSKFSWTYRCETIESWFY